MTRYASATAFRIVLEERERKMFVAPAEDMLAREWEIREIVAEIGTALHRGALPGEEADI